jgi:PadR family transcriptional regulator PadR
MIKGARGVDPAFQEYALKFESELNRGISTLTVLAIIKHYGTDGVHAYQISKDLNELTKKVLKIEEGTIYPLLRKLEEDGILKSKREKDGRRKKSYSMTNYGAKVFNYFEGFFSNLIESISPLFDIYVDSKQDRYVFCSNCGNRINIANTEFQFCDVCGQNIENELKSRGYKNE